MKLTTIGFIIIIIGLIMLAYTGFNYTTTEKIIDLGPMEIMAKKNHLIQWPPIVGFILIIGGVIVIVMERRTKA